MKYCAYCGTSLQDDMRFCPKCGKASANMSDEELALQKNEQDSKEIPAASMIHKHTAKKRSAVIAIALGIVAVLFTLCGVFLLRDFSKRPAAIEKTAESVVLISSYDKFGELRATGSGFMMYDDSTIITNYHVIDRALEIRVSTDEDHTYEVESVLAYDAKNDIAILRTSRPTGLHPLSGGNSEKLKKGESVVAIGSPLGNKNTVSTGVLSGRWYNNESGIDELQFSAPISSGSSGGALFNKRGQVVGITSATFSDGQNLNLAVPIEAVETAYQNKGKALSVEECFRDVYKTAGRYYLQSEFVTYSELLLNSQKYDDTIVTTIVYLAPKNDGSFLAFASEADFYTFGYDEDAAIICLDNTASIHIDKDYSGYAMICGEYSYIDFSRLLYEYLYSFFGTSRTISIKYFELY